MTNRGTPTLDQLQVFLAVAETGSFAGAGRKLRRATAAITYAVVGLELQLGVTLFTRGATRKPVLTDAGHAVLADARRVAHDVDSLRARVQGLTEGLEAEVSLVVDVLLPTQRLVTALRDFEAEFPTVPLRLRVEALGAVAQAVLTRQATIGISGPLPGVADGTERIEIEGVQLTPVAAASHPLSQVRGTTAPSEARHHLQLVLTDPSQLTRGRDFGVVALKTWRLSDLGAKHALLLAGVGWGSMPEPVVREDIAAGRLVKLDLPDWREGAYRLEVLTRTDNPPGRAGSWLVERLSRTTAT